MKRDMIALMLYLVIFGALLVLSFFDYLKSIPIIEAGIPQINLIVMMLSAIGFAKTIFHIIRF